MIDAVSSTLTNSTANNSTTTSVESLPVSLKIAIFGTLGTLVVIIVVLVIVMICKSRNAKGNYFGHGPKVKKKVFDGTDSQKISMQDVDSIKEPGIDLGDLYHNTTDKMSSVGTIGNNGGYNMETGRTREIYPWRKPTVAPSSFLNYQ